MAKPTKIPASRDRNPDEQNAEHSSLNVKIIVALIGGVCLILAESFTGFFTNILTRDATQVVFTNTPAQIAAHPTLPGTELPVLPSWTPPFLTEITPTLTALPTSRIGKPIHPGQPFSVISSYDPSGHTGDIGDVEISKTGEVIRFTYHTNGEGPHEWEYKYKNGQLNETPAKFAGVIFVDPPNNFGTSATGGFDLREASGTIRWEARSLQDETSVTFYIGGVEWMWDEKKMVRDSVPYPDTLPRLSLGNHVVSEVWQTFEYDLSYYPDDYFRCVIGAFGWSIEWGKHPPLYEIEVRNVTYYP